MKLQTLRDLFIEQLLDVQSAEEQLSHALPKMAAAASDEDLKEAFKEHLKETYEQLDRIRKIITHVGGGARTETCNAMKGLIEEAEDLINTEGDPTVKDAALIAAAQRIEHYEIAAYGTLVCYANELDEDEAKCDLEKSLGEEYDADKALGKIANGGFFSKGVNQESVES